MCWIASNYFITYYQGKVMTASLLQLQAKGELDTYLTGNPSISYFKYASHRHTNFAIQTVELLFNSGINWGKKLECVVSNKGDLLSHLYIQIKIPALTTPNRNQAARWVSNLGYALIKDVEIEIGGQRMDFHTGEYLYTFDQFYTPGGKRQGVNYFTGNTIEPEEERILYIPLHFWFNEHLNLALPLVALQMHEVVIRINLRSFQDVTNGADVEIPLTDVSLIADYIILDIPERNSLTNKKLEFLVHQVQTNSDKSTNKTKYPVDLVLRNNVKELIWMIESSATRNNLNNTKSYFRYTFGQNFNPIKKATLQLNGTDKFTDLPGEYFNLIQPYQHHSNIPENAGIHLYSFSLSPESFHPSGSLNFSMIENSTLIIELQDKYYEGPNKGASALTRVYATSYNILVIENGTCTMKYF